jgi:hypothetical protein
MTLARLSNLGPASGDPSSFSSISADFMIANDQININKAVVVGNGVNVDGSGTIALAGAGSLNCQGVAKLVAAQNSPSQVLQGLTGASVQNGNLTLPFRLTGSLGNPKFILSSLGSASQITALERLAGRKSGQQATSQSGQTPQQDLIQSLGGLLKKKKQTQPQPAK